MMHQAQEMFGPNVLLNKKVSLLYFALFLPYLRHFLLTVVILAVEQMLGNFDQKISDRYKLIEYIRDDDEKEIIYFSSQYFAEVTLPVALSNVFSVFSYRQKCF